MRIVTPCWIGLVLGLAMLLEPTTARGQATAPGKPRALKVAIICQDGAGAKGDEVEALLTVELSASKEFGLVERQAIRKVIDEQKLQAFSDAASAIKIGQLVGADLLLLVEPLKAGKPPTLRLRAAETASGIILMDQLEEFQSLAQKPERFRQAVETVLRKIAVPVPDRKLAGLIGVSSEEPGKSLDPLATSLGMVLRVDLAQSPNVMVLEREQLQHLIAERGLSGMEVKLRGSTRLIEVKIKRQQGPPAKNNLDAMVRITEIAGGKAQTFSLTLPAGDLPALRRQLADATLKALAAPLPPQAAGDIKAEAKAFHERAMALLLNGDLQEALAVAETAYALDPQPTYCATVIRCCHDIFNNIKPSFDNFVRMTDSQVRTLDQLNAERRMMEIHLEMSSRLASSVLPDRADPNALGWRPPDVNLHSDLGAMFPLPDPPQTAEQKVIQEIVDLTKQDYRLWFDLYRKQGWSVDHLNFGQTNYLNAAPFLVRNGAEFCTVVQSACEEFERDEASGLRKKTEKGRIYPDLSFSVGALAASEELGNVTIKETRPLLTWLTQQADPLLRIQGWNALAAFPGSDGREAAVKALDILFR